MLYSGIDLHKRTVVISTVDEAGRVVTEDSLPTSRAAVARYFQWLPEPTVATVEATSSWYWLRDLLEREQVPLTLAHAKFVKAIAYAKVAFTLFLEIDGIERFDSVKNFFSYCRVVPGADISAGKRRHGRLRWRTAPSGYATFR